MEARWNNHVAIERAPINRYIAYTRSVIFVRSLFPRFSSMNTNRVSSWFASSSRPVYITPPSLSVLNSFSPVTRLAILNNWANPEYLVFPGREETKNITRACRDTRTYTRMYIIYVFAKVGTVFFIFPPPPPPSSLVSAHEVVRFRRRKFPRKGEIPSLLLFVSPPFVHARLAFHPFLVIILWNYRSRFSEESYERRIIRVAYERWCARKPGALERSDPRPPKQPPRTRDITRAPNGAAHVNPLQLHM